MTNYTDEQKNSIMQMPAAVLLGAMMADDGSFIASMREFMTGKKFISEAGSLYPGNALVQEMVKNANLPKTEEIVKQVFSHGDRSAMLAECQQKISAGQIVLAHDEEANQFKAFLVATAEKVVNAAGEGFFGSQGARVSGQEASYVDQLKQQLGVTAAPGI